jgi:PAS domain S-box-containing protein
LIEHIARSQAAEQRARDSEAKYRLVADHGTDMIFVLNREAELTYVSPASLELLDYGPEQLLGTKPVQMTHPDDAEQVDTIYRDMFAGLDRAQMTKRIRHRDGHWIWVEAFFRLIRDRYTGDPLNICGTFRDISSRLAAEAAQHAAESNFRLLAENANDVVSRCDRNGFWRYVSPAASRVFGVAHTSLLGKRMLDFVHPDDRAAMRERIAKLQAGTQEDERPSFRIVRPDASVAWLEASSHVVFDLLTDEPDGYVSVLRDVTERVIHEAAVRQSEERYRLLLQSAVFTQAVYMLDVNGIIESWSDGAERITGYSAQETIGQHYSKLFTREDIEQGLPARQLLIALTTGQFDIEAWRQRKDGSRFFARVSIRPVYREDGTLRGFAKMTHDMTTERVEREQREIIIEAAPNGMMIIDEAGKISLANAELERMFGYPRGALIGQPVETLVPDTLQLLQNGQATAFTSPSASGQDRAGCKRDGSEISVEMLLSPVETGAGRIVVASLFDTSERKRLAAEKAEAERRERQAIEATNASLERLSRDLDRARDRAEQATLAKSRFLAGMSHELRTPLNGILGYAQLLHMDGGLNPTQNSRVNAMLQAGRHLLEMSTYVLDLSEIEDDMVTMRYLDVDVAALAEAALDLIRPSGLAKHLQLSLVVDEDTPTILYTDPTRLRQILLNLLRHVARSTERGGIELRLQPALKHPSLRFEIIATDPGTPRDQPATSLLSPDETLDFETAYGRAGDGPGLAVADRLATLLGGTLEYRSNPNGGNTFSLEVPPSDRADSEPHAEPPRQDGDSQKPRPLHVLVVDDVPINRDVASSFLRAVGHTATCVADGTSAVAAAATTDFDAVLMDVQMPQVDGLEATRRIRGLPGPRGRVPIVALTAQAFADQIAVCHESGMDSHVSKPFTLEMLTEAVQRARSKRHEATEIRDVVEAEG